MWVRVRETVCCRGVRVREKEKWFADDGVREIANKGLRPDFLRFSSEANNCGLAAARDLATEIYSPRYSWVIKEKQEASSCNIKWLLYVPSGIIVRFIILSLFLCRN